MKNIWFLVSCLLLIAMYQFFRATEEKTSDFLKYEKNIYVDGAYDYEFKNGDSTIFKISFYSSGELKYFINYPKGYKQMISYYKENGNIQSKLKVDSLNRTFGRAYYFYESSGNLAGTYNYIQGIKTGSAVSYHDSTDRVKEVMLYNDEGQLYYRKTFDKYGNLIKTEGSID